jgi:hypothetical protein
MPIELARCLKRSYDQSVRPDNSLVHISPSGAPGQRPERKLIIIAGRCGRLGNRITLFASFIAWAEEHGYRLMNPTFHTYAHLFEATRKSIFYQYPPRSQPDWLDVIPGFFQAIRKTRILAHIAKTISLVNQRLPLFGRRTMTLRESRKPGELITSLESPELEQRIRSAKVVLVNGWSFRAPGCVHKHQDKIRAYFTPLAKHARAGQQAVERLRQHADLVTGVHIRHGDYAGWKQGKYYFPASRYCAWMAEFAGQFPGSRMAFLVCSDEPRFASEFPGLSVAFSTGEPIEDTCALAECNYIMGPVSSFTQWASLYGNKPLFHMTDRDSHVERERFRVCYLDEVPN